MFQFQFDEDKEDSISNPPSKESTKEFVVGDRIKCDKHSGVVKYVGPVNPHPGIWLGIEWDEPQRGKHSGNVDNIQYFESSIPNSASFIRPHKAKKAIDVFTALEERYGHDKDIMSKIKLLDENNTPRQVNYKDLKILDLGGKEISELGKPSQLSNMCPNVEFLNLEENLITSWKAIAEICQSFKYLKTLHLSGNPLLKPDFNKSGVIIMLPHLDHLILGKVKYNWNDIISLSVIWPQITNLQVQFNIISKIIPPTNSLLNLTSLDLESNQITNWEEVINLNVCQSLEYLNLCGNQITNIRFPLNPTLEEKNIQTTFLFQNLKKLNIGQNLIQDWISITELNKLQKLIELRIELNPVFDNDTKVNNRQMIIARIGNLNKLEGVEIIKDERRDAEIDYIKKYSNKWKVEGTEIRFAVENPRYAELIKKYGESQVDNCPKIQTLQSSLLTLKFCPVGNSIKPCTRKVVPNMKIQKLKMLLQRIFDISTPITYLGVVSSRNTNITFPLENDTFDLSQYSVEDGDKVIIKWV